MPLRRPLASSLSRIPPRPWRRDALAAFCVAVALAACGSEPPPVPSERGDVEAARPPPAGGPVSAPPEAGPVSPPPGSGPVSAPPASPVDPPTAGPEEAPPDAAPPPTTGDSRADATHTLADVPVLRALRIGGQPVADRIVFEFDGDGLPAWSIGYVDRPVYECGSGDVVRLPGDAWLQVRFTGAQAHTEAGEGTTGPKLRTLDMTNLVALARLCDFEGEVTWVAAVRRPEGYTPRVLGAPARLAVDIAH